jgi:uncharacterized protein with PQ loop repeat
MLLRIYKSNRAANYLIIPLTGILLWGKHLLFPQAYPYYEGEADSTFFSPVIQWLENNPLLQVILALALVIMIAFLLLHVNSRYSITSNRGMLTAPLFIIIVSGFHGLQTLHPVLFGTLLVCLAIQRLFTAFDTPNLYSAAFDAGFFLGLAILFHGNLFVLIPAFIYGTSTMFGEFRWRELVIGLVGLFVPLLIAFSYIFVIDGLPDLFHYWKVSLVTQNNHFVSDEFLQVYTGVLLLLVLFGSIHLIRSYDTRKISTRRIWKLFFVIFIFSISGILLIPAASKELVIMAAVPCSFLISDYLMAMRSRFWQEFTFWFLLLMSVTIQFMNK